MKKYLVFVLVVLPSYCYALMNPYMFGITTDGGDATDYTADAAMEGYWMMEQADEAAAVDGHANSNDLTAFSDGTGPTQSVLDDAMQGSYSAEFVASSYDRYEITDANLSDGFPGRATATTGDGSDMSVGCWAKLDLNVPSGIIGKWDSGDNHSYNIRSTDTNFEFSVSSNGTNQTLITGSTTITDDGSTWYHVVGVFDDTANLIYLYVDGSSDGTAVAYTNTIFIGTDEFHIGRTALGGTTDGHMDECFVMSRVLSSTEVAEIYAHGLAGDR